MVATTITIPARRGKAVFVEQGRRVSVINTHGNQVVDMWAFRAGFLTEFMSMEHARTVLMRLVPRAGDSLATNMRRPILTVVEDTSPGVHDTLIASCDPERYRLLGVEGYHDNCTDNLTAAMAELGLREPETPAPLNLFMNVGWKEDGSLVLDEPLSRAGDYVTFRAEMDTVVAFSACPQDVLPVNGAARRPVEVEIRID